MSTSVNRAILLGNLTRDPELKALPSGTDVCEFGLAMNRKWKTEGGEDREEVCFVDVSCFGKTAENVHKYCRKGGSVYVFGRLDFRQWEDKNGGGRRSKLSVVAEAVQFLSSAPNRFEGEQPQQRSERPQRPSEPVRNDAPPRTDRQSRASSYLAGGKAPQTGSNAPQFDPNEDMNELGDRFGPE